MPTLFEESFRSSDLKEVPTFDRSRDMVMSRAVRDRLVYINASRRVEESLDYQISKITELSSD